MADADKKLNTQNESDSDLLFVKETSRYKLSFRLKNEQMECQVDIELFPARTSSEELDSEIIEDKVDSEAVDLNEVTGGKQSLAPVTIPIIPTPLLTPPDLFWFFQQNNIIQTIDYAAVYDFCAAIEMGLSLEPTVLAKGIEPITGADGWFEMIVKTSGEDTEFDEDDDGNIDFRTLNAYSEIEPGQKLGMVHPPQDGIPGITVHGLLIPAERGKPFKLIAGAGVILKFENRVAFLKNLVEPCLRNRLFPWWINW